MRDLAIRNLYPQVFAIDGDKIIDANNNGVVVDETLIQAEITRLQAEYDSLQYARDRATAYPSLQDQADMAYWDRKNGTTTLDDAIDAVKAAHPKPE